MQNLLINLNLLADSNTGIDIDTDGFAELVFQVLVPLLTILGIISVVGAGLWFVITWLMYLLTSDEDEKDEKLKKFKKQWIWCLVAALIGVGAGGLFGTFMGIFGYNFSFS